MAGLNPPPEITFIGSEHRLARAIGRPVRRFLAVEAAGGLVLLLATATALVWANSPWKDSYHDLWESEFKLSIGNYTLGGDHHLTLELLVNDALMAIFFFVVGLEIKRELVDGQLKDRRAAALPAMAALGGMVVPALIYFALNAGDSDAAQGWGIPMATDIAFAVGVMSLLGDRVGRPLKVFLLTLAIVDDIGAILVIALVYTDHISYDWLMAAGVLTVIILLMKHIRIWYIPLYVLLGSALWLCTFESGVHATIAGVVLGLITPARPLQTREQAARWVEWLRGKDENLYSVDIQYASFHMRESMSVAERLESTIHPLSSFVIIPVFALANAGVDLGGGVIGDAAGSAVTWGVALGLVAGKTLGVFGATWIGLRMPFTSRTPGMNNLNLLGISAIAGIGFTVALFVTSLAFDSDLLIDEAKIGILFASLVAGVLGVLFLLAGTTPRAKVGEPTAAEEVIAAAERGS
jgi:NhaA family Na+:H+ antiporter